MLDSLKRHCERLAAKHLDCENVVDTYVFANVSKSLIFLLFQVWFFVHPFISAYSCVNHNPGVQRAPFLKFRFQPTPPVFDTWNVGQFLIESVKKSHPPLNQSDANPKSNATWSSSYPRASWSLLLFYTFSSHKSIIFSLLWLPFVMTLALILRRRIEKHSKAKLILWGNGKDSNTLYWRKKRLVNMTSVPPWRKGRDLKF